ncbi:MAG: hypothetical protein EOQ56_23620 [Mesorhizobium sp.]|nr:MAG: hypothetical protein EOQ56_23620 [Mesorhizobium sp.]
MDSFIAKANIGRFQDLLAHETDPERRRLIQGLLGSEQQKLQVADIQARKLSNLGEGGEIPTNPSAKAFSSHQNSLYDVPGKGKPERIRIRTGSLSRSAGTSNVGPVSASDRRADS